MTLETFDSRNGTFSDFDTHWLRAVYFLAVAALAHTHHVDDLVKSHLAEAVLKACNGKCRSRCAPSQEDMSDMAVASIETLTKANPHLLVIKH